MKCHRCDQATMMAAFSKGGFKTDSEVTLSCLNGHSETFGIVETYADWFSGVCDRASHLRKVMTATINDPTTRLAAHRALDAMLASIVEVVLKR